jgi:hypothetical protein
LWESSDQPPARWHAQGDGPVQYFADSPAGAWAEFLRHEEITDVEDLAGVERAIWAVEIGDPPSERPALPDDVLRGGRSSYSECQAAAQQMQSQGSVGLIAISAALAAEEAAGWHVDEGPRRADPQDPSVIVLFGRRPDLEGWPVVLDGRPESSLLTHIRHF